MSDQPSETYAIWAEHSDGRRAGYGVSSKKEAEARAAELRLAGYTVEITISESEPR